MSERNDIEVIVVPEVPKVLSDEEIYVYIPTATNDKKGIASYDDTHFNVVNGEVSVKEEYFTGLRDATIEEHNQDEAAHPFIQSKVEKGLQDVNDALTAGLQELEDADEANVAKAEKDLADHNVGPTAHENRFVLKFDISNVMSSFTGEDVNNTAKVASAKALKEVVDKINQDLVDAINTLNSDISDTNDVVDITLKNIEYNSATGVMTFTKVNNQTITVDLPAEKILKDGASYYDANTRTLHLILMDNSDISIDVYDLVDEYYGDDITIESFEEDGVKLFKIADAYKQTLDGYGTTIEKHEEELYTNIPADLETKVPKTDIVDNLVTDDSTKVLSAKQGKVLKDTVDKHISDVEDEFTSTTGTLNTRITDEVAYLNTRITDEVADINSDIATVRNDYDTKIGNVQSTVNKTVKNVAYDESTAKITVTYVDNTTTSISLPKESFVESVSVDENTAMVTMTIKNGQSVTFSLASFIDYYYADEITIEQYVDGNDGNKRKFRIKSTYLDGVNQRITTLESKHNTDIQNLESKHDTEIDNLEQKHNTELSNLNTSLSKDISDLDIQVNGDMSAIDTRLIAAEKQIIALQKIEGFGSIGHADEITIFLDTNTGKLTVKHLEMPDGSVLTIDKKSRAEYDSTTINNNTIYLVTETDNTLSLLFGGNMIYSKGIRDSETNESITIRGLTKTVFDGLSSKADDKIYLIDNGDNTLSIYYNGAMISPPDLSNYVKFTDYATNSKAGVGLSSSNYGVFRNTSNNYWQVKTATDEEITAKTNTFKPITPSNVDKAVKEGIANNGIALTDTEKTAAQTWLGVKDIVDSLGDLAYRDSLAKGNVGLGNVDNTSDANKPVSTAQATAIADAKKAGTDAQTSIDNHKADKNNPHSVTKAQVGLSNVTNDAQVKRTEMGANNGVATLGSDGKIPSSQLPSYVDDVLEYASYSAFPITGETGKIYVSLDNNRTYRWGGTSYVEISASLALGETSGTAYAGEKGKANANAIAALQTRAGNIENVNTTQGTAISNIQTKNTEQDSAIAALQNRASTIEGQIGSINTKDSTQDEAITALQTKNTEQDNAITALQTKNSEQDTAISNAQSTANSKANKSTTVNATLSASSWQGSSAPYTYTLSVSGVTATSNQEILEALNITATQLEALQGANIVDGGQSANSITLKAFGEKPTIDIPIRVILRGD